MHNNNLCAFFAVLLVFSIAPNGVPAASAAKCATLYAFTGKPDGAHPRGGLIFDSSGNLYGTSFYGGVSGFGTVFELSRNRDGIWTDKVLYSFTGKDDGEYPYGGLAADSTGNLYGTTYFGGNQQQGVVYQLAPGSNGKWTETVLYNFCSVSRCADGSSPHAGLIFDASGNLYGTTLNGGASNAGTVFQLMPNSHGGWTEKVLHSFIGGDGVGPYAGLILDGQGKLYGTTQFGGSGRGVVFELAPKSNGRWAEQVLYSFGNGTDGSAPLAGLVFDTAGNLYGTTSGGGSHAHGVVFKLRPHGGSWSENVLYSFKGGRDGKYPGASLVFDLSGNLYGTTFFGGWSPYSNGTAFKLRPDSNGRWSETVLHRFRGHPQGFPEAELIIDAAGNLYGTTYGYASKGSVFEIIP
jgi:uncharacterized repeat protein (TIGR03803 family)